MKNALSVYVQLLAPYLGYSWNVPLRIGEGMADQAFRQYTMVANDLALVIHGRHIVDKRVDEVV